MKGHTVPEMRQQVPCSRTAIRNGSYMAAGRRSARMGRALLAHGIEVDRQWHAASGVLETVEMFSGRRSSGRDAALSARGCVGRSMCLHPV